MIIKMKNNKKDEKTSDGFFYNLDNISPAYINKKNPKFFEIDNLKYSGLLIVNYNREQNDLILRRLIETNINMNISIFYEKKDKSKTIKELTYYIGNMGADIKENGKKNRMDFNLIAFTHNDAEYIRKEMQINNEELYNIFMYIEIFSEEEKELEYLLDKIEGIVESSGMQSRRAYFRQEQVFISTLPLMKNNEDVKIVTKRNILTGGLLATYPFISSSIFDKEGIYFGNNLNNYSLVFIDRFNREKYKNSNMCVFGTSGAGKSFFTKLLILRSRIFGIEQYVIDPEREYNKLCEELEGVLLKIGPTSKTYVNIFDIREESLEENEKGYLATKIGKLIGFFNLIFGEINEEEKGILENKLIECYKKKKINFNDNSLYKADENNKKRFKKSNEMPKLEDLYNCLNEKDKVQKIFKIKLFPFIKGSLKFLNNYTNIEINNKLIIADIYELGEENIKYGMYIFTELFWDKIKINRSINKAIYLDEIWRLIGVTSNRNVASFIYKIFKTIRKYGGSATAITQDVSDLFSLEKGTYGKSILNNSSIKCFFSLEEENIKILSEYSNLSEMEKIQIKGLKKGEALMFVGDNHITVRVEADDFERKIIE